MFRFLLLILIPVLASSEENFQNMIQKIMTTIKQEKNGIQNSSLSNIQNPFFTEPLKTSSDIQTSKCFDFDIKTATKIEFQRIPNIDRFIAHKIIEFRKTHLVSRPEDLIYVIGFTVKKVDSIRNYINKYKCKIKKVKTKKVAKKKRKKRVAKKYIPKLKIQIIFNSRVKILNRWYKVGDKIHRFKIDKVEPESITLSKGSTTKKIFVTRKKNLLHLFAESE